MRKVSPIKIHSWLLLTIAALCAFWVDVVYLKQVCRKLRRMINWKLFEMRCLYITLVKRCIFSGHIAKAGVSCSDILQLRASVDYSFNQ